MAHNIKYQLNKNDEIERVDGEPVVDPHTKRQEIIKKLVAYVERYQVAANMEAARERNAEIVQQAGKHNEWISKRRENKCLRYENQSAIRERTQRENELMQFHHQQRIQEEEGERVGNIFGAAVIALTLLLIVTTYFILKVYGAI